MMRSEMAIPFRVPRQEGFVPQPFPPYNPFFSKNANSHKAKFVPLDFLVRSVVVSRVYPRCVEWSACPLQSALPLLRGREKAAVIGKVSADLNRTVAALRKFQKDRDLERGQLHICYEAEPTGFVLARRLIKLGYGLQRNCSL